MVGETVQQRAGAAFRAKHLGPLVAGQVGGHHYGAPLVALAEDLEEQFRSGGGQGDEAGLCANLSSALSLRTRYHWPVADAFHLYQVVENEVWPIMVKLPACFRSYSVHRRSAWHIQRSHIPIWQ